MSTGPFLLEFCPEFSTGTGYIFSTRTFSVFFIFPSIFNDLQTFALLKIPVETMSQEKHVPHIHSSKAAQLVWHFRKEKKLMPCNFSFQSSPMNKEKWMKVKSLWFEILYWCALLKFQKLWICCFQLGVVPCFLRRIFMRACADSAAAPSGFWFRAQLAVAAFLKKDALKFVFYFPLEVGEKNMRASDGNHLSPNCVLEMAEGEPLFWAN